MRGKSYICEYCNREFDYDEDWTEEDANKEAEGLFGIKDASNNSEMAQVCEDCYKKLMTINN